MKFIVLLIVLLVNLINAFQDDEFVADVSSSLIVEHTFDQGTNPVFTKRGIINIQSLSSGIAQFRQDGSTLTSDDIAALKDAAENEGIYRVRVRSKNEDIHYVSSFLRACALLESELSDIITVNVDNSGHVLGVSLQVPQPHCVSDMKQKAAAISKQQTFSTVVQVVQTGQGPSPDTQSYLAKLEKERMEKQQGSQADNRSFFAKYWMYFVPVVIFVMMSSGNGGGGR